MRESFGKILNGIITKAKHLKYLIKIILYRIIVLFRLSNSEAYFFILHLKIKKELIPAINSLNFNKQKTNKIYNKIINLLNQAKKLNIDMPNIYLSAALAALVMGKIENWKLNILQYLNRQKKLALKNQNKDCDFQIIEAGYVASSIGTGLTLDAWLKSQILGFQKSKRLILPLLPGHKRNMCNHCILDYYKDYINIIEDERQAKYYYSILKHHQASHHVHIPCGDNFSGYYAHSAAIYIQSIWEEQGREPLFKLKEEHNKRGIETLKKLGLPQNAWYVVCHVREKGFKGEEKFRDSDISSYFGAFQEIVKRGGWIFRLGDNKMSPLPKMNQVIDYALSEYKSDWMDIFLIASAKFMIATSSGLHAISHIFNIPTVMTNCLPSSTAILTKKDLFLPRLMKSKDNKKLLDLDKLMAPPYSLAFVDGTFENIFRVKVIPNTKLEIENLCIEMMDKLDNKIIYSQEDEKLQELFKLKTAKKEVMVGFPNLKIQSRIGKDFLNNHKRLLINT